MLLWRPGRTSRPAVARAPVNPEQSLASRLLRHRRARPLLVGELLVVLVLVKVYDIIRSLASTREADAFSHGWSILSLESPFNVNFDLTLNHWLVRSDLLTDLAGLWYQFAHLTVTMSVLACCFRFRPDIYRRARNSLILVNVVGLIVFWLYPVAPPRLLPGSGFVDTTAAFWQEAARQVSANEFAALPSLHLAWATWSVLVARALLRNRPWPRRLAPIHGLITALVVVATANHYVLDVVAGIGVCLLSAMAVGLIGPLRPASKDGSRSVASSVEAENSMA
jgi:PAP2 superfamily protein